MLFHNPRSAYDYDNGMEEDSHFMFSATVPVTPRRAVFRALPVGTRLVMSLGTLADDVMVNSAFNPMQQSHLIDRIRAQLLQEVRLVSCFSCSFLKVKMQMQAGKSVLEQCVSFHW